MIKLIRPQVMPTEAEIEALCEQADYLEGVLWADPSHRLDMDATRNISNEIDEFSTGTKAFWRGVIETTGYIGMNRSTWNGGQPGGRAYPRLELKGSYHFLMKFIDFLAEEQVQNIAWPDTDAALRFAASGNHLKLAGTRAQDAIRTLYAGQEIGLDSVRERVEEILLWTGRA